MKRILTIGLGLFALYAYSLAHAEPMPADDGDGIELPQPLPPADLGDQQGEPLKPRIRNHLNLQRRQSETPSAHGIPGTPSNDYRQMFKRYLPDTA